MNNVEAKQVRQEIDELLTSGRLERLETVSAHVFKLFGREWKELTNQNILVHVFHDSLDDVNKLLARDHFKIVFDFVPLSASFTFNCLSKKFVRLCLNRFDRNAPAYGFGFSNTHEKDVFCNQLDRIYKLAKANLTPTLRMTSLEMANLSLQSPSAPPRPKLPPLYTDSPRRDFYAPSSPGYTPLPPPPPFSLDYASSPCKHYSPYTPIWTSYAQPPFYCRPPPPVTPCADSFDAPYQGESLNDYSFCENRTPLPKYDAPDLSKLPLSDHHVAPVVQDSPSERSFTEMPISSEALLSACSKKTDCDPSDKLEDKVAAAERRVRALMDSIQPVGSFWDNPAENSLDEGRTAVASPRASSRSENPAGVIGSPVKGKGGVLGSRHQTPNRSWQWP